MKKVAIVQSNYIPWKGYFDLMNYVDEFIIYDDVQYTRRDWRNRNKIKTRDGVKWLSVPVKSKGKYDQLIMETEIHGSDWALHHWQLLEQNYRNAPYFSLYSDEIEQLLRTPFVLLRDLNVTFIEYIRASMGINTTISQSTDYASHGAKTDRLLSICKSCNADVYVSGPTAKNYLDEEKFKASNKKVEWFSYEGYPQYKQLWGSFEHRVSVLDLLFNCGQQSRQLLEKKT